MAAATAHNTALHITMAARLDEGDSLVAAARVFTTGLEEAEEEGEEESGPTQGELLPEENETEKE